MSGHKDAGSKRAERDDGVLQKTGKIIGFRGLAIDDVRDLINEGGKWIEASSQRHQWRGYERAR